MTQSDKARRRAATTANGGIAPVAVHNYCTYSNWGCWCDECRADNTRHVAEGRAARAIVTGVYGGTAPVAVHNMSTYSNWSCECLDCLEAHRLANREYRASKGG